MTINDFASFAPQKIFLLQGSEVTFASLAEASHERHPNTYITSVPRFTMEDATALVETMVDMSGQSQLILVYCTIFSPDAAQILLKSFEEPSPLVTVIFVTPHPYLMPATIRSRVMLISHIAAYEIDTVFSNKTAALAYIAKEFGSESEDDAATKRAGAVRVLDMLEIIAKKRRSKATIVYNAKHMLFKANLPTKYVLEYAVNLVL